jgi:hypothetical protein
MAMYLFGKRFRTGYAIRNRGKKDRFYPRKLAVMTKVMAYYIRINVFPNKLAFFRQMGYQYNQRDEETKEMNSFNGQFWMSLALVVTFAFTGWQFSPFGTIWFLVTLAPFTQFKLLGQFIAERYLYLPQLGIYLIIVGAFGNSPVVMAVILTAYIYRSHIYIPSFRKIENLYKNGIQNYPDCISNYANLGERFLHTGYVIQTLLLITYLLRDGNRLYTIPILQ